VATGVATKQRVVERVSQPVAHTTSRRVRRGPAGPPGPAGGNGTSGTNGTNGTNGNTGPRGPSDAWFDFNNGPTTVGQTASPTTLDTVTPAAGPVAVFGKVRINWAVPAMTSGGAQVICDLNEGGSLRDEAVVWVGNDPGAIDNPDTTMSLQYANNASGAA